MTDMSKEAMKLALEALEQLRTPLRVNTSLDAYDVGRAITALRKALAENPAQQQEPVYWQWRRKDQPWSLEYTFNSEVQVTTKDSERRALYTSPQPAQQDIPDLIAGALGVSRGTAYDLMREALAENPAQQEPVECQYGKGGYACCEGGPCKADEQNNTPQPAQQEPVGCIPSHWVDKAKQIADGPIAYPNAERAQQAIALIKILLKSTPPARKPLTHEQRVDLLAKFEAHKHEWHAPAILIDMVEAAHGIKGDA